MPHAWAAAKDDEIPVSEGLWEDVSDQTAIEPQTPKLRGDSNPATVSVARPTTG